MSPNRKTAFLDQEHFDRIKSQFAKFNEPWGDDEIEELKSMAADCIPIKDMSGQLQRTPNSIRLKLKALNLYVPPAAPRLWKPEEDRDLVSSYSEGKPFEEMAERFGRSVDAIVSRLVRLRINLFNN